jgi:hypothetical protein
MRQNIGRHFYSIGCALKPIQIQFDQMMVCLPFPKHLSHSYVWAQFIIATLNIEYTLENKKTKRCDYQM